MDDWKLNARAVVRLKNEHHTFVILLVSLYDNTDININYFHERILYRCNEY